MLTVIDKVSQGRGELLKEFASSQVKTERE